MLTKYTNHILELILPHHGGDCDLLRGIANVGKNKVTFHFLNTAGKGSDRQDLTR